MTLSSLLTLGITGASFVLLLLNRSLAEKDTLVSVLTPFVVMLLVCKHPASLPTNTVIPFRDSFSSRKNKKNRLRKYLNILCTEKNGFLCFSVSAKQDAPQQSSNKFGSAFGFHCFSVSAKQDAPQQSSNKFGSAFGFHCFSFCGIEPRQWLCRVV